MGAGGSKAETLEELVTASGAARSDFLRNLFGKYDGLENQDFYTLFGLERYTQVENEQVQNRIKMKFHELMLQWHPDKNTNKDQDECTVWTAKIVLARHVLLDPELKRRYDLELRRQRGEEDKWSTYGWYIKWGYAILATLGGLALVISGGAAVAFTGGASLGISVAGSALLISGVNGGLRMWKDPDCSTEQYIKDIAVGAAMGALGGGLSIAGGAAVAGCAGAGAKVCVGAAMGALTTTTSKITSDAVDLAISEGLAGERIKQMVDAKSRDEIFSAQNAKQVLKTAALGAAVGGAVQGLASACNGAANSSEYIDDVANVIQAGRRVPLELQGAEVVPKMLSFSLAQLMGAGTLANRVQKLAPEVSHKLVSDASKADFILSRTNNQKDFADQAVVALLREGFTLCADNSLTSNWGGPGWVDRYVEDAQKTRWGVLVLENGKDFFKSQPCCEELYAARCAGLNLTKVHGSSIQRGEYLWVLITDELFSTRQRYEEVMRRRHGEQYTPHYHEAETFDEHHYTYYCIVPKGRQARLTGAAKQKF